MKTLTTLVLSFFLMLSAGCSVTSQARAADDGYFSQAELDSMLAPVALYPDSVLSHVLIAATYPLEVIQAARWSREHPGLRGEDAVAAVEYQDWDASVKALVAFPDLLQRMDEDLQWTQNLGDAFLVQEEEVIASIQYLRSEAYSQGHLRSNDRVKVVREREYIYIEPARTRVVYVPYYDPRVIYTNWRWSSYRPHYWHRPPGFSVSVNFHWGRPYHIRPSFYFSSFHWPTRRVVVVNHHHYYNEHRFHSGRQVARFEHARHWRHDPVHRRGVSYRGRVEKTRFVENDRPASARVAASRERTVARSERREWSENRRSSLDLDRSRSRASARGERVAELRNQNRDSERSSITGRDDARTASRSRSGSIDRARSGNDRATASRSSRDATQRSISGRAPARADSSSRDRSDNRASTARSSRVTESLRSSNRSSRSEARGRSEISSRSSSAERSASLQRSLEAQRSTGTRRASESSRSSSQRRSISVPRSLTTRPSSSRESAPSRASSSSRGYEPRSAPSRSTRSLPEASSRASAPTRSTPSRSSSTRAAPQRRSTPAAPSRQSSAPSRRSESRSSRSSRSSASSRSRDGGGSRRDGERK